MKIAISATGPHLHSPIDPRFGRAPWLLVVDSETGAVINSIDNSAAGSVAHGAGIEAAGRLANEGVEVILTGRMGPKAAAVCARAGIWIREAVNGTVREALDSFAREDGRQTAAQPAPAMAVSGRAPGQGAGCRSAGRGQGRGLGGGRRQGNW